MALRIVRRLNIDPVTMRIPSIIIAKPTQIPTQCRPSAFPCPCPEQDNDNRPPFCRYIRCKHPTVCKNADMCYVDWEPELIKE